LKVKRISFLALPILLILGAGVAVLLRYSVLSKNQMELPSAPADRVATSPHAPNAQHPREVARIMKLLPDIPPDASVDEIIAMLRLAKSWNGGSVSSTHCCMFWDVAPRYRLELSFDPVPRDGKLTLELREAGFSAQGKPGFGPDEYHTVYPYRTWKGMVTK
jgi:hypothetical protein